MAEQRTYSREELEKMCRRALFHGQLFGSNCERQKLNLSHTFPFGSTFEEMANNFLEMEKINK